MSNYFPDWRDYDRIIEYAKESRGNLGIKNRLEFALNNMPQKEEFLHDLADRIEIKYDFVDKMEIEEFLHISSIETTNFKDDLAELGQDAGVMWLYSYYISYFGDNFSLKNRDENGSMNDKNIILHATNDNTKPSNHLFESKGLRTFNSSFKLFQLKRLHNWLLMEQFIAPINFDDFNYLFSGQPIKDSTTALNWVKKYNGREFKMALVWLLKTITEEKEDSNLLFHKIEFLVTFNGSNRSYKCFLKKYYKIKTLKNSTDFSRLKDYVQALILTSGEV